jgi:hypothetical protein
MAMRPHVMGNHATRRAVINIAQTPADVGARRQASGSCTVYTITVAPRAASAPRRKVTKGTREAVRHGALLCWLLEATKAYYGGALLGER